MVRHRGWVRERAGWPEGKLAWLLVVLCGVGLAGCEGSAMMRAAAERAGMEGELQWELRWGRRQGSFARADGEADMDEDGADGEGGRDQRDEA